jgi:hypothetical protein
MKLLVIISVGFNETHQLLNTFFALVSYWREKWEYNEEVRQVFMHLRDAHDSVKRENCTVRVLLSFGIYETR